MREKQLAKKEQKKKKKKQYERRRRIRTYLSHVYFSLKLARSRPAGGEDGRAVAVLVGVYKGNRLLQRVGMGHDHDCTYRGLDTWDIKDKYVLPDVEYIAQNIVRRSQYTTNI
jgi:hypothetical protein